MSHINVIPSYRTMEGGFQIRRTFPSPELDLLDPFLLLDYFGPMHVEPGSKPGVSDHPHRGFQTVTYIVQGEVEHNDSKGNHGVIKPGGIQWMVAGKGIVHSEFPSSHLSHHGGILQGIQLWVNLPADKKMIEPAYFDLTSQDLPLMVDTNWDLRIIGGTYEGHKSPADLLWPVFIAHLRLKKGDFNWKVDPGYSSGFLVLSGSVTATAWDTTLEVEESHLGVINESAEVNFHASQTTDILLLSGKPIKEPVARYGPFVMNSMGEIKQALIDYQNGDFH